MSGRIIQKNASTEDQQSKETLKLTYAGSVGQLLMLSIMGNKTDA
jgi:hypothetical protein